MLKIMVTFERAKQQLVGNRACRPRRDLRDFPTTYVAGALSDKSGFIGGDKCLVDGAES